MQLLLIRHARAASQFGSSDDARPLTDEGREDYQHIAQEIVDQGVSLDAIWHSPARRTTETAEILAETAGLRDNAIRVAPWLSTSHGRDEILPLLMQLTSEATAIVGHEPTMSALTALLMGRSRMMFSPGTSVCLEFDGPIAVGQGRLKWLLEPS